MLHLFGGIESYMKIDQQIYTVQHEMQSIHLHIE